MCEIAQQDENSLSTMEGGAPASSLEALAVHLNYVETFFPEILKEQNLLFRTFGKFYLLISFSFLF